MAGPDSEREFVRLLGRALGPQSEELIGDDAAELQLSGRFVVTVDSQIEGVHFPTGLDASTVARRLLAVNLSDIAASGAEPRFGFLALNAPPQFDHAAFFASLGQAASYHGVTIAGGDLATNDRLSASLTLIGELVDGTTAIRRSAARPGDRLWIGGSLGESALGRHLLEAGARWNVVEAEVDSLGIPNSLVKSACSAIHRHLRPTPQLQLGSWLSRTPRAAGLDISDGLALDLHRLLDSSEVGALIDSEALPQADDFKELVSYLKLDPEELVLAGGEDYVLLFALPSDVVPPSELGATEIGGVTASPGAQIVRNGQKDRLRPSGWDHLRIQTSEPK